jgi:hypothetical protein
VDLRPQELQLRRGCSQWRRAGGRENEVELWGKSGVLEARW